jgi:hypothetical protein
MTTHVDGLSAKWTSACHFRNPPAGPCYRRNLPGGCQKEIKPKSNIRAKIPTPERTP